MRKYVLLVFAIMLSCVNILLAQNVWEDSACLYQSNRTEILLRDEISTGTIIFFTIDGQLYLNTFNNIGTPENQLPLLINLTNERNPNYYITRSNDDNFIIAWQENDYLNLRKITTNGYDVWGAYYLVSLDNLPSGTILEYQIFGDNELVSLLVNHVDYFDYQNSIIQYDISLANNTAQLLTQATIYQGDNLYSLTGKMTSDGLTLMWLQTDNSTLFIMRDGLIQQIDNTATPINYKTCKIVELNNNNTIYAKLSKSFLNSEENYQDLYIYNESDSTFTTLGFGHAIIDIKKISENEFLAVSMSDNELTYTKLNQLGNTISTTSITHNYQQIIEEIPVTADEIVSIDSHLSDNEYKLAISTINHSYFSGYQPRITIFDYNLENNETSLIEHNLPSFDYGRYSSSFALLGNSDLTLLNQIKFDYYSVYKLFSIPYEENSQVTVNPYEICQADDFNAFELKSFMWNGTNQLLIRNSPYLVGNSSTLLEVEINQNAEISTSGLVSPRISKYKLHKLSTNNYLLHYSVSNYFSTGQYLKVYKDDGETYTSNLQGLTEENYNFNSISDVNDGNGWFAYISDNFKFHRIEDNTLQESYTEPIGNHRLLAIKGNYLIFQNNNQFRITKLDSNGEIAEGWSADGQVFTSIYDYSPYNISLNSYQDKLVFTYYTMNYCQIFILDPQNLTETYSHLLPIINPSSFNSDISKTDFIIGNKYCFIKNYDGYLIMRCLDLNNDLTELWQTSILEESIDSFDIKKLDDRFVIAYTTTNEARIHLKVLDFYGNEDQYSEDYTLPLELEFHYSPVISLLDNNTIFVSRIENRALHTPSVYCDLIDLTYFVPNSSEDVSPLTFSASNYPNPFNPETTISYNLPKAGDVSVQIYNLKGQLVKTLINEVQAQGYQKVIWKGNNNQDKQVSSGIYLYKIKSTGGVISGKLVLMK